MRQWRGKKILITGGAGFIGSNLAIALVKLGAKVTVVDNFAPNQGGNRFNLAPIKNKIKLVVGDIRKATLIKSLVKDKDYIFHLARQTDHILSLTDPFPDIDVNIGGTVVLLEALRKHFFRPLAPSSLNEVRRLSLSTRTSLPVANFRLPKENVSFAPYAKDLSSCTTQFTLRSSVCPRFIYIGTRGQYGRAVKLPVNEEAPTNPRGIYELTNLAAEKMVQIYHDVHGIPAIMLRLTNVYGPRSQMKHDHYGVVNWFIRLALEGKPIPVFGDGRLQRDFLYIDDAVSAILKCSLNDECYGQIINVGSSQPISFLTLIKEITRIAKRGSWQFAPFTPERLAQEPGDFASDISKIRKLTGWQPKTTLKQGLKKTINYYKRYKNYYWRNLRE